MTNGAIQLGVFRDRASAEQAVARLGALGYSPDEISVAMNGPVHAAHFSDAGSSHVSEGTVAGFALGGGLGAIVAGLAIAGGVAALVVAGPLAAVLGGFGAGGALGGMLGALIGAGVPEHHAALIDEGVANGGILVGVTPRPGHHDDLRRLFDPDEAFTAGTI